MSLKPPKKSDLDKKWMKKRLDRAIKIQPEYHLIVTEGTDTEPEYFGSIKDVINKKYPEKIKLDVYGEGDNTISLFQKTALFMCRSQTRRARPMRKIAISSALILRSLP